MRKERAFAQMISVIAFVKKQRRDMEERERKFGDVKSDHFSMILDDLEALKNKYRDEADKTFEIHKALKSEVNEDAVENLANAVVMSAIEDYEEALSSNRDGAVGVRRAIRNFAEKESGFYSSADIIGCLSRIDKAYRKFKVVATDNLDGIMHMTKTLKHRHEHTDYSVPANPYRCPLDGGGLWIKKTNRESGAVTIGCTNCNLSVEI